LPDFKGTKLCHDTGVCVAFRDIHKVEVIDHDKLLFEEPGVVGSGGNSGFQALNLAAQFGARRIVLIGFDMHGANGLHWYGHNKGKNMRNPNDVSYLRWRKAFAKNAGLLKRMNIEVINASLESALVCFEKCALDKVIKKWT